MRIILPTATSLGEGGQNISAVPRWPAVAVSAGVVAASITFSTMSHASDATIGATHYATRAVGFLAGRGVKLVFGPVSGFIAEQAAIEFGDGLVKPVVRTGTRQTAYITSAAVGVTVVALSTVAIHVGSWLYNKGHYAITRYLTQPPSEVVACLSEVENDVMLLSVEGVPARPVDLIGHPLMNSMGDP